MSSTTPTLATALTDILNAVVNVIDQIAQTISANASAIATVLIVGGLVYGAVQLFRKFSPAVSGFFRSLF
jgi:hypothetical protein